MPGCFHASSLEMFFSIEYCESLSTVASYGEQCKTEMAYCTSLTTLSEEATLWPSSTFSEAVYMTTFPTKSRKLFMQFGRLFAQQICFRPANANFRKWVSNSKFLKTISYNIQKLEFVKTLTL